MAEEQRRGSPVRVLAKAAEIRYGRLLMIRPRWHFRAGECRFFASRCPNGACFPFLPPTKVFDFCVPRSEFSSKRVQFQHRGSLRPVERAVQDLPRYRLHALQLRHFPGGDGQVRSGQPSPNVRHNPPPRITLLHPSAVLLLLVLI